MATPECQTLAQTRQTLFMGDSLRSMLLTAYAFWLVGTIATVVGWVLIVGAIVLLALSLLGRRSSRAPATA